MNATAQAVEQRLKTLENHLDQENPVLVKTVKSFRDLDYVARRMGLLNPDQSFATQIPWWPLISVLGTFSSGKSTFINHFLGHRLQRTGNQAVDDHFTVVCYSREETGHALPGVALDSDPRFPLYQISNDIDQVALGEGQRIDAYLQLKTCPSERLRGKIIIDSPGFDADAQRTATLRIIDHIIDLSDLVLVFFDGRHPEPGAMRDTLDHLVTNTISRPDSGKFLYILNQLDTAAREDNPEEVVAAWQRALGERGLTAGRFFSIYNPDAAVPIENAGLRARFETKRDADLGEIHKRMEQVEVERAYRIVGTLDKNARDIEEKVVPFLNRAVERWRKRTLWAVGTVFVLFLALVLTISIKAGVWEGTSGTDGLLGNPILLIATVVLLGLAGLAAHFGIRALAAKSLLPSLRKEAQRSDVRGDLVAAFLRNTTPWHSIFSRSPVGWSRRARKKLRRVLMDTDNYIQTLNDTFTNPSGEDLASVQTTPPPEAKEPQPTQPPPATS